jgi:hypothetical protein
VIPAIDHAVIVVKDLSEQSRDGAKYILVLESGSAFYLDTFTQVGTSYVGKRGGQTPVVLPPGDSWRCYGIDSVHVVTARDALRHNLTAAADAQATHDEFRSVGGQLVETPLAEVPVPAPIEARVPGQYL